MGQHTDMYDAGWKFLKKKLKKFAPKHAAQDFELAELTAAKANNPQMVISGCLFHSTSCMFKNHRCCGLSKAYYDFPQYRSWLKMIMAVPLLPSGMITEAFTELLRQPLFLPLLSDLKNFQNYKR